MHITFDLLLGIALYALVRSMDHAITAAIVRDYLKVMVYGLVALVLLVAVVLHLF